MKREFKYAKRNKKKRNCEKCIHFAGFIGKNYFKCDATMYEDQKEPHCHDIYDRDVLKKGTCNLFVPIEVRDLDDMVRNNITLERSIEEDDQSLPDKE